MRIAFVTLVASAFALSPSPAAAQAAQGAPTPLFASNDPIHLVINAPISTLSRNRSFNGAVAGTMVDPAGQTLPISLSLRGITRRMSETCDFPPLRVTFTSPPPKTSLFAGQGKLKLVTHCGSGGASQQYELLEYSAYRMLNVLSPRSFRVRLASIDYRDANGRPIVSRYGFFLEDLKDLARRNGLKPAHAPERVSLAALSPMDAARYAMFQHMIANHDWSMRAGPAGKDCCHNAELIGTLAAGSAIPIPYDFDFSGMVGAPYAMPPEQLGIDSVKQRVYRGYCAHNAQATEVAREFRAAQPQILGVLSQTPGLEPASQRRAASFLQGFFNQIGSDQDVAANVLKRCVT